GQTDPDDLHFLLCTDSHYTVGGTWSRTAQVLKSVCRRISPDALIFLGDFTDGDLPVEETLRYAKRVLEDLESTGLPLFICLGNHDFNTMSSMKARVSRKAAEKLFLGRNENMVIDYEYQRVRMIFLASFDPDDRSNPYGFSTADVFWFSRAVAAAPRGFRILVFSHVTPAAEIHHWSDTIRNGPKMISVLEKEQKKHGNVLAWICGHNHADQIFRTYAFPIVTIASLKIDHYKDPDGGITTYRRKSYGGVAPERLYDGVSRECFDILSVSKDKNELRFLRFGAGEDRIV
ncbi:MAG: metallophosphoesterase, partial [Lachnospiraceae bacterium]|nr:metallophosphoesterase [Lachnospiraceae bacterium]